MNLTRELNQAYASDGLIHRLGRALLLMSSILAIGWITQKPKVTPQIASSPPQKTRTVADLIRSGDEMMQLQRESNVSELHTMAEKEYRAALALDPKNADALLGLAWVSSGRHNFRASCDYAKQALQHRPQMANAYALIADADVELGRYEDAYAHCQQALDLSPGLSTYSRAGHLLWLTGQPEEALNLMRKAIRSGGTQPEHIAWCRVEIAQMLLNAGSVAFAAAEAAQALQVLPRHPRMLVVMGRIYVAQGDFPAAESCFARSLEFEPSHDSLLNLGELQEFLGRQKEADATFARLLLFHTLDPSHPAEFARFCADHQRSLPSALAAVENALRESQSIDLLHTHAWCLHKNGDATRAKRVIIEALKWNTPDASLHFHTGIIHAKLGETEAARRYLEKALALNPNFHLRDAAIAKRTLARLPQRESFRPESQK
jgi:tetratricopeptide (TPR) repeat protein